MDEILKAHDELIANMPEGEIHDADDCAVCKLKDVSHERGEMDKEYTKAELDEAVKAALAPIQAELDKLKEAQAAGEIDAQVAEVKAQAEKRETELQAELDTVTLRAENAEKLHADSLVWIQAVADEAAEADLAEARKEARIEVLKAETSFSDETIDKRISDWAQLSDEDFDAQLEVFKELSTASKEVVEDADKQVETAMRGTRKEAVKKAGFLTRLNDLNDKVSDSGLSLKSL